MKRFASVIVVLSIVALIQGCSSSRHEIVFQPGTIDTEHFVRKVDRFVVIADGSLSMADRSRGQRKLGISESFLTSLNQTIPDLGYEGALRTFGRGLCGSQGKSVSIVELTDYLTSSFGDGVNRYQCANGSSPLNLALDAAGADLGAGNGPSAIVIVSDGLDMGKKEVAAASSLRAAFGDHFDLYAVQIGSSKKGRAVLEEVVAAGGAGYREISG